MAETGATVPLVAPFLSRLGVYSGKPVRGGVSQWGGFGLATNHLLGRGGQLIPHAFCNTLCTKNGTVTLRFRVHPSIAASHRRWSITYKRALSTAITVMRFTDPSAGTSDFRIPGGAAGDFFTHEHDETVAVPTGSETELAPTFEEVDNQSAPTIAWVSCVELPRPDLAVDASEYGVELPKLNQGRVVYTTTGTGPGGVAVSQLQALDVSRRAGLFQFARGSNDYLTLSATAGYAPVFAAPITLLGRSLYVGDTVRTVKARVRASSGAATTGNVRLTMTSGDTATFAITAAMASTWLSADLDVDCDDLATADGLPGATHDKCLIEWERTAGASSVVIESISIING